METTLENIKEILEKLAEEGEIDIDTDIDAYAEYIENWHIKTGDYTEAVRQFEDCYIGELDLKDYVEELFLDCHNVPSEIVTYLDWDKIVHDYSYDYWQSDSGHLFRNI